jgi:hypothetical protein
VLSDAQRRVLRSASTRPLTLVIGPPGTGKSYTIAAIAVEHISRGESVLIASKMNHAVDVVGNKIERQLGVRGVVVRGGRHTYSWELRNRLNEILNGIRNVDASAAAAKAKRLGTEATRLRGAIAALERSIVKRFDIARRRGEILASNQRGLSARFLLWYIRWRVGRESTLGTMIAELERLLERNVAVAARLVESINRERMAHVLSRHRTQLRTLLNALRARSGVRQEELLGSIDFRVLLRALPVWLTNLSDVHRVLPLSGELFDLAIIDEATQCDIASCLPIFQRARRVVVVGDPHQLRHLSFLSKARQRALVEKHGIPPDLEALYSYRDKSVLDFVNDRIVDQAGVVFLNEHFRSVPSIIGFSNETFYGGALHIMTEGPEEDATVGVNVDVCEGRQEASGENLAEIRAIIRQVARYVEESGTNTAPSIGILSPFRRQADHISRHLAKALTMDVFRRHEIMIGTAHTFQGEERDIMLISLAVDDRSHSARMRFIERADVFNVTVTRARRIQHIYSSLTRGHSAADDSLLGRYLRHVAAPAPTDKETRLGSGDDVASEVAGELVRRGMTVRSSYRVAGSIVDLLIERGGSFCGVDLIGFPGHPDEPLSLERYRMFHRAGLRIVPVSYAEWAFKREDVLAAIAALLGGA